MIETFRSRSGHREKSELGKALPRLGLKRPTCNHGGVHSLWRSVQGPTTERRCGRRCTSEICSSYIGTKFKSYLAVLIMAKVRNANRAIEPFFSHSTGIRPPIFVSQFSACYKTTSLSWVPDTPAIFSWAQSPEGSWRRQSRLIPR